MILMGIKKQKFIAVTNLKPDSKGRVTLSKLAVGVSSYDVFQDEDGRLLLEPKVEIPAREKWLFQNSEALASVRRGLEDAKNGRTRSLGSFAKYLDDEDDE
jgi:hypothetical protein